jgi:phosphatidylethanolamine/phosphatidyl-N-methylethanolamine N-methyltransferase
MAKKRAFLKQFIQDRKTVGSVRPSSRFLSEKMLENIDFLDAKTIVELGPGTGVFTEKILEKMAVDAQLLVFELNKNFMRGLRKKIKDPRVIFIHDSAEKMEEYLEKHHLAQADVIISSLPLFNFPQELRETIISNAYKILKNAGKYIQFQYSTQAKKLLETTFDQVSITFTPLNFPPAFVYTCDKKMP